MKRLLLFCIVFFSITGFSQEKRIALVIGNSSYLHGRSLINPVNDANLMASTLIDLGFDVIKRTNTSKQILDQTILEFWRMLVNYDVVLLFYAGHGIQVDGINYIIPIDANLEDELALQIEAINIENIIKQFERYNKNINIVILDACRDIPFRSWMRSESVGFAAMPAPSGTIIAFAASAGSTSPDVVGSNGLYTQVLTKQMKKPQRIEDVFINTRNIVRTASDGKQNPQEWSQLNSSFYFTEILSNENEVKEIVQPEVYANNNQVFESRESNANEKLRFNKQQAYLGDEKLSVREVRDYLRGSNYEAFRLYKSYDINNRIKLGLVNLSLAGLCVGCLNWIITGDQTELATGLVIGAVTGLPAIYFHISSIQKFNNFMLYYKPERYITLRIGPTENGLGLVYSF